MTDENSVIETLQTNEKDGGESLKGIIIALVLLLLGGVGLGVYFFNFVEKKTTYEAPIIKESEQKQDLSQGKSDNQKKIVASGEKDFSYKGNFEFNLDAPIEESKVNLKIEDFQILSMDKGLQSRISLGNSLFNLEEKTGNKKVELNSLDIITDEEKTYIKAEGEKLKSIFIETFQYDNPQIVEIVKHIFSEKYVEIDNAKKLLEIIDSNDELIISFIKGIMSPNARQYFQKYGISEELNKKFFSKDSYKLLFEETLRDDDKIYVKLKDESCVFAINLINKISEDIGNPTNINETDCKEQLEKINEMLANSLYITQNGEKETITYNGLAQFEISYENGEILSVNILAPMFSLKYEEKHLSVNFTLIIPGVNVSLKIEQDFKDKNKGSFHMGFDAQGQSFLFEANFLNNTVTNRKLEGNLGDDTDGLKFTGNGDNKKGKLYYQAMGKREKLSKGTYSYDNGTHLLSIVAPDTVIKGKIINTDGSSEFILTSKIGTEKSMNMKGNIKYGDGKINLLSFILKLEFPEGDFDGKIDYKENNLDINLLAVNKEIEEKINFTAKGKLSKEEKNITIGTKVNNIEVMNGTIVGDENSCKIEYREHIEHETEKKLIINMNKKIEGNKTTRDGNIKATEGGETVITANWKLDYSSEEVEYKIPTNTKKIDIPLFQRIQIPAFAGMVIITEDK